MRRAEAVHFLLEMVSHRLVVIELRLEVLQVRVREEPDFLHFSRFIHLRQASALAL